MDKKIVVLIGAAGSVGLHRLASYPHTLIRDCPLLRQTLDLNQYESMIFAVGTRAILKDYYRSQDETYLVIEINGFNWLVLPEHVEVAQSD